MDAINPQELMSVLGDHIPFEDFSMAILIKKSLSGEKQNEDNENGSTRKGYDINEDITNAINAIDAKLQSLPDTQSKLLYLADEKCNTEIKSLASKISNNQDTIIKINNIIKEWLTIKYDFFDAKMQIEGNRINIVSPMGTINYQAEKNLALMNVYEEQLRDAYNKLNKIFIDEPEPLLFTGLFLENKFINKVKWIGRYSELQYLVNGIKGKLKIDKDCWIRTSNCFQKLKNGVYVDFKPESVANPKSAEVTGEKKHILDAAILCIMKQRS